MSEKKTTADRILETGRELFNTRGYAATSLNDIASEIGISKGNLNYHFPTKQALVLRLRDDTLSLVQQRRSSYVPGDIADDYVEHLLFAMEVTWHNRFLLRDRMHFEASLDESDSELAADFDELLTLMKRIDSAGLFRKEAVADLTVLTRSIWIVSRYWMDYLRESERKLSVSWEDQERGVNHHFALLLPCLTAEGKRRFTAALARPQRELP